MLSKFQEELTTLINRHSVENGSETPDFILAVYLSACLAAFEAATVRREVWYGRAPKEINLSDQPAQPGRWGPAMMRDERIAREVLATIKENAERFDLDPAFCDYDAMRQEDRATLLAAVRVGLVFLEAAGFSAGSLAEAARRVMAQCHDGSGQG